MAITLENMRYQDAEIFKKAAVEIKAWILVRHTNEHSLPYIGKAGFLPKPMQCKFKTADYGSWIENRFYNAAGLVASPDILPGIYCQKKISFWKKYAGRLGMTLNQLDKPNEIRQSQFTINRDPASRYYGCVQLNGKYLYGDYDLFDVVPIGHERRNLYSVNEERNGQSHNRGARMLQVENYVNKRIGENMVQHGGEAQFSSDYQAVYAFSPDPHDKQMVYSWSEYDTRVQYEQTWFRKLAGMEAYT